MEQIIYIEQGDKDKASETTRGFSIKETKNRVFINALGAELAMKYLAQENISISNIYNMHNIHRIIEEFDISDIMLPNIHIDVRVIYDENLIFVPKTHFEYEIIPDLYLVFKMSKDLSFVEFLGFFESKMLNKNNQNNDYYFFEKEKLSHPSDLKSFIENFEGNTTKIFSEEELINNQKLALSYIDNDISEKDKKDLLNVLSKSSILREDLIEFNNFEVISYHTATTEDLKPIAEINENDFIADEFDAFESNNEFDNFDDDLEIVENSSEENTENSLEQIINIENDSEESGIDEISEIGNDIVTGNDIETFDGLDGDVDSLNIGEGPKSTDSEEETTNLQDWTTLTDEVNNDNSETTDIIDENNNQTFVENTLIDINDELSLSSDEETIDEIPDVNDITLSEDLIDIDNELTIDSGEEPIEEISEGNDITLSEEPTDIDNELIIDSDEEAPYEPDNFPESTEVSEYVIEEDLNEINEIQDSNETTVLEQVETETIDTQKDLTENDELPVPNSESDTISFDDIDNVLFSLENDNSQEISENKANSFENSTVITNSKDIVAREIPIDINIEDNKQEDEKLEVLYNENREIPNDVETAFNLENPIQEKGKKAIIFASVLVALIATGSIGAYMMLNKNNSQQQTAKKPTSNINENVVPPAIKDQPIPNISQNKKPEENTAKVAKQEQPVASTQKPAGETPYIDVKKLGWSIPSYLSYNDTFKKYLQTAGKSLKLSLSSDLLMATEYNYSDLIQVDITLSKEGSIKDAKILQTSGSTQIDGIVLQTVKDTLNVVKAPAGLVQGDSAHLTLKIYL